MAPFNRRSGLGVTGIVVAGRGGGRVADTVVAGIRVAGHGGGRPRRGGACLQLDQGGLGLSPRFVGVADAASGRPRFAYALDRPLQLALRLAPRRRVFLGGHLGCGGIVASGLDPLPLGLLTRLRLAQHRAELGDGVGSGGRGFLATATARHTSTLADAACPLHAPTLSWVFLVAVAAALTLGALGAVTSSGAVAVPTDPLGCDELLFDPDGVLDRTAVEREARQTASALGADLHVRVERSVDGALDDRMGQLERQCPGWSEGGERAGDLVVVMYTSLEREASVYYGADQGPALERTWGPAVDAMIDQFRLGRFDEGVEDGLRVLRTPGLVPSGVDVDVDVGDDPGGREGRGVPPQLWLFGLAFFGLVAWGMFRRSTVDSFAGGHDDDDDYDDYDDYEDGADGADLGADLGGNGWWSSLGGRRRSGLSSFGGFGRSSSSSRRSSSSRASSRSRGSRRSGGGSKRW